ncbi:Krr1-domain-containing protein [Periconia macrospinosa]|uniref:Krr1-domain-containing protein n=1 Tax=Periconia macrospinosa TaxID=97972 RepID=A0A2V1DYM1_9PLEO|nr:Krr1-domain-containing protein [Periconia macrospinosa]
MARTKDKGSSTAVKREFSSEPATLNGQSDRPSKKTKLLDDTDDEAEEEGDGAGASFKVNEEYARRFEHNKKREEQHRLEEKYGKGRALQDEEDSEDSEDGVEEDDAGEFVTEALDADISATLQALRSKDPRIYDANVKFFREEEDENATPTNGAPKESSMTLKQYHTKNLLEGKFDDDEEAPPKTYAQEQEEVRQNLLRETRAAEDDDEEDDFLVAKSRIEPAPKTERNTITTADVENADKDPENFLSNYMASRAWVPKGDNRFQPLESDDDEDDAAAEEYENSYNLYFEDTTNANEKLVTYARDAVAKTTVRREAQSGRAKAREAARAKREAERKQREEDLTRLRKLKVDEMEQKVNKIREVGGLKGRDFNVAEWKDVLEGDWSDDQWDKEMRKRFGESYYEDTGVDSGSENDGEKRRKPKKPKFDDDIDIKDLIPEFKDDEDEKPEFTLSSDDDDADEGDEDAEAGAENDDEEEISGKSKQSAKQRKRERAEAKSAARRDRRLIENLVDDSLKYEAAMASSTKKAPPTRFRYRETSPTSFGMTARDILLASDKQLNEFAGLKKLASFRDPAKKKKDKKHLSKKARLRQWRQETFGDAEGPKGGFEVLVGDEVQGGGDVQMGGTEGEEVTLKEGGGKKRKRKNKGKAKA